MSHIGKDLEKKEEIKRQDALTQNKGISLEENKEILKGGLVTDEEINKVKVKKEKAGEEDKKVKTGKTGGQEVSEKISQLKESAQMLPVIKPEKKALTREEALLEMEKYHKKLEAQENSLFDEKQKAKIKRNKFDKIRSGDKEKRAEEAVKRQANAEKILEAEEEIKKLSYTDKEFDRTEFEKILKDFMKMSWEPYPMDNDENFAKNLVKNYRYCMDIEKFRQMVEHAVSYGYFPEKVSIDEVQTKIAGILEMKKYLEVQKELMKNPYYQYMAKGDISYNAEQLERLKKNTKDGDLKSYAENMLALKKLSFVRKKGMDSVKKKAASEGRRQAQILTTRAEKRQIIRTFTEEAKVIHRIDRFRDPDYDRKYTRKDFELALNGFKKRSLKDLHFKSIRDIAENFKNNIRIFEEAREFERLLLIAVQRGDAPADNEMIELRAKLRTIKNAEYMVYDIQREVMFKPDKFLNEKTWDEFSAEMMQDVKSEIVPDQDYDVPMPGKSMETCYKKILKTMKDEHKNRNETIKTVYKISHPKKVEKEGEEDDYTWEYDQIPADELARRSADYQKNAFICEFMGDTEKYNKYGYGRRVDCFKKVYAKEKGLKGDMSEFKGRVLNRYTYGMSSEELKAVIDIQEFGTDKDREKLWKKIIAEAEAVNMNEYDTEDPYALLDNVDYRIRMAGIFMNIDSAAKYLTDKKEKDKAKALYDMGTGHAGTYGGMAQTMESRWWKSMPLTEWYKLKDNVAELKDFVIDAARPTEGDEVRKIYIDGKCIAKNTAEAITFDNMYEALDGWSVAKISINNKERGKKGRINNAYISRYEAYKATGLIKDTTPEELKGLRDFYQKKLAGSVVNIFDDPINDNQSVSSRVAGIEKEFKKIMSFDLTLCNFSSYADIAASEKDGRFEKCREMFFTVDKAGRLLDYYEARVAEGEESCNFNAEELKEIRARVALIKCGTAFFGAEFEGLIKDEEIERSGMSLDEVLHLSEAEIKEKIDAAKKGDNKDAEGFWSRVQTYVKNLGGFDVGMDLRNLIDSKRVECRCTDKGTLTDILNKLNNVKGILEDKYVEDEETGESAFPFGEMHFHTYQPEEDFLSEFASSFAEKKYTVSEREAKMNLESSRLHKKYNNCKNLKILHENAENNRIAKRRNISLKARMAVGEESFMNLSAFMTGNKDDDEKLLSEYADKDSRIKVLDELTEKMCRYEFTDLTLETDEEFVSEAPKLEEISRMARGYEGLLKENPDYLKDLRRRLGPDYFKFMNKYESMLSISDYYRARKLLITDPYYVNHYNDELSANHDDRSTEDERHIADLINLVAFCSKFIDDGDITGRSDAGTEDAVREMEEKSRKRSYLFGKADLKKADISYTKKADKEIEKYFNKVLEDDEDLSLTEIRNKIGQSDEEHPFPDAKDLETEAVKNHIKMIRRERKMANGNDDLTGVFDVGERELFDKLQPMVEDKVIKLTDSDANEELSLKSTPKRLINSIVLLYGKDMPSEEIAEIIEGFNVIENKELDMSDKKNFEYAKMRWLNSAKKLFYLEYDAVKRFESTYGTLPDQLPPGSFMHSLGSSKELFFARSMFTQDMTEFIEDKSCTIDGKQFSLGEYLVAEGLIREDELTDCRHLCGGFYQPVNAMYKDYHSKAATAFDSDAENDDIFGNSTENLYNEKESRRVYGFKGPKLSHNEEKKYWKDAFDKGEQTLYGNAAVQKFRKDSLGLHSDEELQEMRDKRKQEASRIESYRRKVEARASNLSRYAKNKLKAEKIQVDEKIIRKLVYIHPGMLDETNGEDDLGEFVSFVKDFTGAGIPEEEKKAKRSAAYSKLTQRMKDIRNYNLRITDPDNFIEKEVMKGAPGVFYFGSKLMKSLVLEKLTDAVQSLMTEETDKTMISEEVYKDFRKIQDLELSNRLMIGLKTTASYLDLKDIENREKTVPDFEIALTERFLADLGGSRYTIEDIFKGTTRRDMIKKKYGIDIKSRSDILGLDEEKQEPLRLKKKPAQKIEEEKAIEEEKVIEEEKAIEEEKKEEENKNVINIINEEEDKEEENGRINVAKEVQAQKVIYYEIPPVDYEKNIVAKDKGEHVKYENQGSTVYCWACVMSGLINSFAGKQVSDLKTLKNYKPVFPKFKESGIKKEEDYKAGKSLVNDMLKGKAYGNPTIFGDYIFEALKGQDVAVRSAIIGRYPDRRDYCKRRFLETVSGSLKKGPVGLLRGGHFVLIRELKDDDILMVNDSLSKTPDSLQPYSKSVTELFNGKDGNEQLELVWLEDMKGRKNELASQFDLNYDEKTGEFSFKNEQDVNAQKPGEATFKQVHNEQTILHQNGIEAMTQLYQDVVFDSVYLPKKMNAKKG